MSEPKNKPKVPIETVIEYAWEWWSKLQDFEKEDWIVKAYMKKHNITESEVEI